MSSKKTKTLSEEGRIPNGGEVELVSSATVEPRETIPGSVPLNEVKISTCLPEKYHVKIVIELPAESAERLLDLYQRNDPILTKALAWFRVLNIWLVR